MQTTQQLRELADGLERAIAQADDLALAQFLAPPLLGQMLAAAAAIREEGGRLLPARSGLSWMLSRRPPAGPGRCWLRLRFEDLTICEYPEAATSAGAGLHELEVDLDTRSSPWRVHRLVDVTPT